MFSAHQKLRDHLRGYTDRTKKALKELLKNSNTIKIRTVEAIENKVRKNTTLED
jgi:hypothetical protein